MNSREYEKAILDGLLKKYHNRRAKNIQTGRRIILKPAEIYKNYTKNNAKTEEKECLNEAVTKLLNRGFVTVDYLKFSEDIEKIYLSEESIDYIYEYLRMQYDVVPQSTISNRIREMVKDYVNGGEIVRKYCDSILVQIEDPRVFTDPERIEANLKMIGFLEQNTENLYVREASMLVYGDSKWFEDNNCDEICTFLREATGIVREENERNDGILGIFHVVWTEQDIFIKGDWKIEWDDYSLETSKLQGGIAITSNDVQNIRNITVPSSGVMTIENKASYRRMKHMDCAMMYLGGFANRHQIRFLKKVMGDNPDVEYRHFGDIDIGGFLIHKHLCRETGKDFGLYCMGVGQLKDERVKGCLKELTDRDRNRLKVLAEDDLYGEVLRYMEEHNVKLEQEIVSYYLDREGEL